jgi:hypothetical protein
MPGVIYEVLPQMQNAVVWGRLRRRPQFYCFARAPCSHGGSLHQTSRCSRSRDHAAPERCRRCYTPLWSSKIRGWNWAPGRTFSQSGGERTIAPGATQTWTATTKQTDNKNRLMPRGRYGVQVHLMRPKATNNLSNVLFITLADNVSK